MLARISAALQPAPPGLAVLALHGMLEDSVSAEGSDAHPQQKMTPRRLRALLLAFRQAGYRFLSLEESLRPPALPAGHYALLTFDDGYFSTLRAVPVLEELGIPAAVFVTTRPVEEGRSFWWDVVYRELRARGRAAEVERALLHWKARPPAELEPGLEAEFGRGCFRPRGEDDRPLTVAEVRALAARPGFSIGNHTHEHFILPRCSAAGIEEQIGRAQSRLRDWTGREPEALAFPNGDASPEVLAVVRRFGFRLALTLRSRLNPWPPLAAGQTNLEMGRFLIWGDRDPMSQVRAVGSRWSLHRLRDRGRHPAASAG